MTSAICVKKIDFFSNKNKKAIGKLKLEPPEKIWVHEFVCLKGTMCAIKCVDDGKYRMKGVCRSQSKILNSRNMKFA